MLCEALQRIQHTRAVFAGVVVYKVSEMDGAIYRGIGDGDSFDKGSQLTRGERDIGRRDTA